MRTLMNTIIAACLTLTLLTACTQRTHDHDADAGDAAMNKEMMHSDTDILPDRDSVSKVMQAKLAHAQAVLEGIVLADYAQIESNAVALKQISQSGEWLVQESTAYFEFSSEFRSICDDLAEHSRAENLEALAADYNTLTNSCVACHTYLRQERPFRQMPGKVSMR